MRLDGWCYRALQARESAGKCTHHEVQEVCTHGARCTGKLQIAPRVVLQVRAMYSLVKIAISHDERHYSLQCSHTSSHSIMHLHVSLCIFVFSHIFTFHRASSRFTTHLRVSPCIFAFHCDLVCIIAGASIHCPASSLVCRIPFITISDYVWHHTIIILLWTLTLPHLHT
jgi:hypothetical protein